MCLSHPFCISSDYCIVAACFFILFFFAYPMEKYKLEDNTGKMSEKSDPRPALFSCRNHFTFFYWFLLWSCVWVGVRVRLSVYALRVKEQREKSLIELSLIILKCTLANFAVQSSFELFVAITGLLFMFHRNVLQLELMQTRFRTSNQSFFHICRENRQKTKSPRFNVLKLTIQRDFHLFIIFKA